jgi:cytochrome c oxidase cbb3-type subunit III
MTEAARLGSGLFQTHCTYCHGARGEGGRGPDLTTGRYRRGGSDSELFANIKNGIRGTEMSPVRATDQEVWHIVAFIKTLPGVGVQEKVSGDAAAGKAIYEGKGRCGACHAIAGPSGGAIGPGLAGVGRRRSVAYLREALTAPEASILMGFRAIQITNKSGQTATGIRLNEDDISIQLRDTSNNLRSFLKADLREIERNKPALMPSFARTLTGKELDDLVAYLASLQEEQ